MDTYRCIVAKRDLRTFTDRPIAPALLRRILNAGRMSGSSKNSQPWHFVVVRERERLRALAGCGRFAQHVAQAAAAVCVIVDSPRDLFDAGRCAQNIMLAAWNAGVASCPASMHRSEEAGSLLAVPPGRVLATVISLGYPHPRGRGPIERAALRILAGGGRRRLEAMVSWERYGGISATAV